MTAAAAAAAASLPSFEEKGVARGHGWLIVPAAAGAACPAEDEGERETARSHCYQPAANNQRGRQKLVHLARLLRLLPTLLACSTCVRTFRFLHFYSLVSY